MSSVSTAKELYRAAVAMHDASRLIAPHLGHPGQTEQPAVFLAYYLNIGFAVELYLKAFIRREAPNVDVKSFGHRLDDLLAEAETHHFNYELFAIRDIVKIIGPGHKDLNFRYGGTQTYAHFHDLVLADSALMAVSNGLSDLA